MRDIRSDLQERIQTIEARIEGIQVSFERKVQQMSQKRDQMIAELQTEIAALDSMLQLEAKFVGGAGLLDQIVAEARPNGHAGGPNAQLVEIR
jgi:hypothetical protein